MSVTLNKKSRSIYIVGEVTDLMATSFLRKLKVLESTKGIIKVFINSVGGDTYAGLAIVDAITTSSKPVHTIAYGKVMSAATIILAAGKKRFSYPNVDIMVHKGSYKVKADYTEMMGAEYSWIMKTEARYSNILESLTNKPKGYWEALWKDHSFYITPDEALKHNLIDEVINVKI